MSTSNNESTQKQTKYATAKIVILGDPGVGKTALGYKLALGNSAEPTLPLQNFWIVKEFSTKLPDDTECEAVLWDLIRTPAYQSVYPIFLDDVDVALLLFDPTNKRNTLAGVKFWLDQLSHRAKLPPCILVGTRVDRGGLAIPKEDISSFCKSNGIFGGYIETSTLIPEALDELRAKIKTLIRWDRLRETTEISAFNLIRRKVLDLSGSSTVNAMIMHSSELQAMIHASENIDISELEIRASANLIRKQGYIEVLPSSSNGFYILLKPELLMDVASLVVSLAEKDSRGLGALSETQLLRGDISFPELAVLEKTKQRLLVEDVIARLINHDVCFRERYGSENLLIFPELTRQKRPPAEIVLLEDQTYFVEGKVKNVYTALVVLLGYTDSLKRFNLWQNQVQYEYDNKPDQICGFKLAEEQENYIELVLQHDNTSVETHQSFQALFELFLCQREITVRRFAAAVCPNGHTQARNAMVSRLREGKDFTFCSECGSNFALPKTEELRPKVIGPSSWLQSEKSIVRLRKSYETYLVNVKGYWQQEVKPRCYLSFTPDETTWVEKLIRDLSLSGVEILKEKSEITHGDHIVTVESETYKKLWNSSTGSFDNEKSFIRNWLSRNGSLSSINLERNTTMAAPHSIDACAAGDFTDPSHYPVSLFDLVLNLYRIPLTHVDFAPLRQALHEQWERTAAGATTTTQSIKAETSLVETPTMSYQDFQVRVMKDRQIRASSDQGDEEGELQLDLNDIGLAVKLIEANQTNATLLKSFGGQVVSSALPQ